VGGAWGAAGGVGVLNASLRTLSLDLPMVLPLVLAARQVGRGQACFAGSGRVVPGAQPQGGLSLVAVP
jgi:hypothetical protein